MKTLLSLVVAAALAAPAPLLANRVDAEVVVPLPADVWDGAKSSRGSDSNCIQCCVYDNRKYSEGAVLKVDGIVLQCVRDKETVGTRSLIWQPLRQ